MEVQKTEQISFFFVLIELNILYFSQKVRFLERLIIKKTIQNTTIKLRNFSECSKF